MSKLPCAVVVEHGLRPVGDYLFMAYYIPCTPVLLYCLKWFAKMCLRKHTIQSWVYLRLCKHALLDWSAMPSWLKIVAWQGLVFESVWPVIINKIMDLNAFVCIVSITESQMFWFKIENEVVYNFTGMFTDLSSVWTFMYRRLLMTWYMHHWSSFIHHRPIVMSMVCHQPFQCWLDFRHSVVTMKIVLGPKQLLQPFRT